MGMYPAVCDEPDKSIKANNLLYLREDSRHLAGLPFSTGLQLGWMDWNVFTNTSGSKMSDNRRDQLERMIGGIRLVDMFEFEQFIYWGF